MTSAAVALAPKQKRGRPQGETLKESECSISVHRHGCQVGSWPKRLWEPCGSRDGKPVWVSRARKPEELQQLRSWLRQAMCGPPEELEQRLIACAETPRDDSKINSFAIAFQPHTESEEDKNTNPPPLLTERTDPERYNFPLVAKHGLTQPESEVVWRSYRPYPVPSKRLLLTERIRVLWSRGMNDTRAIAWRLRSDPAAVKEKFFPRRSTGGPCVKCESHYRGTRSRLDLAHCPHYSVTYVLDGKRTRALDYTIDAYLAELRRIEPPTTKPALPAWKGSSSGFRYRYFSLPGDSRPRTMDDHFSAIMTGLGGQRSLTNPTLQLEKHFPKGDELWMPG